MNFIPADFVTLRRVIFGTAVLVMTVSCAGPKGASQASSPETFNLSEPELKQRFPQMKKIGVVELSGARIKTRPYGNSADQAYVATGGALLIKKVQSPIYAQAPEITVTPDAAILRGRQALVRQDDRLISGEGDETEITIDGTEVKIQGPHLIRNTKTGRSQLIGRVAVEPTPAPVEIAPVPAPVVPAPVVPAPVITPEPVVVKAAPKKAAPKSVRKPAPTTAAAPAPQKPAPAAKPVAPKPASVVAKPAPAPKPAAKPAAPDRKELLNLMRDPTE